MELLNNELLSEVFGEATVYMKDNTGLNPDGKSIVYYFKNKHPKFSDTVRVRAINKYELTHLCKEYCFNNWYSIQTRYTDTIVPFEIMDKHSNNGFIKKIDSADTEFEAVIKATKWVIENKDKS